QSGRIYGSPISGLAGRFLFWLFLVRCAGYFRDVDGGHSVSDSGGMGMFAIEIGEDHEAEFVLREAQEVHGESLPRARVFEDGMAVGARDAPAKAVAVSFSVGEVR